MISMQNFTIDQIAAAALAAELAKLVSLQQWMNPSDAAKTELEISLLRDRQLVIETRIEMGD